MQVYKHVVIGDSVYIKVLYYNEDSQYPWEYRFLVKRRSPVSSNFPPENALRFATTDEAVRFINKILS